MVQSHEVVCVHHEKGKGIPVTQYRFFVNGFKGFPAIPPNVCVGKR